MRFLVYNIAYGTGAAGGAAAILSAPKYLRTGKSTIRSIIQFIDSSRADVVGLVEIDTGSFRTGFADQTGMVSETLGCYRHCEVKYARGSLFRHMPILGRQANAFFTLGKKPLSAQSYFFPVGMKRLILELNFEGIRFFLVHLALRKKTRRLQLEYLTRLAAINPEPVVIAGDFNAFSGAGETECIKETLGLYDPDTENHPTFPSGAPKKRLDFVLCSKELRKVSFSTPQITLSDHLPVIFDFEYR